VWAVVVVQGAVLGGAFEAAGDELVDLNVVGAFRGFRGPEVLGYGCRADGFAGEPADALEGEDGFGAVGEGFLLRLMLAGCDVRYGVRFYVVAARIFG
jgi:hypothetical protein